MRFKIVALDDDRDVLSLVNEYLDRLGCEVAAFDEACAAVDYLAKNPVNALITDFQMPELTGVEVARVMRASACNRQTQVVLMSGAFRSVPAELADAVDFFLPKPLRLDDLSRVIAAVRPSRLQEKRRYPRLPFETEVECRSGARQLSGRSVNLSEAGMLLHLPDMLQMHATVQMSFRVLREAAIALAARVVRCESSGATGLEFVGLSAPQCLHLRAQCAMLAAC